MKYPVGLENGDDNRSMAWVLGHPGCFSYGPDPTMALQTAGPAILAYIEWVEAHTSQPWLAVGPVEIEHVESWDVYGVTEEYEIVPVDTPDSYGVNAWFKHDWKPLTEVEVERGLQLLDWSREDLLAVVQDVHPDVLARTYPSERWSIDGVMKHIGGAEWWYLDRLSLAFPRSEVPADQFRRLEVVRQHMKEALPKLAGSAQVLGIDAEFWSPRKLLRRAVWHERDHTEHIRKLLETG